MQLFIKDSDIKITYNIILDIHESVLKQNIIETIKKALSGIGFNCGDLEIEHVSNNLNIYFEIKQHPHYYYDQVVEFCKDLGRKIENMDVLVNFCEIR